MHFYTLKYVHELPWVRLLVGDLRNAPAILGIPLKRRGRGSEKCA